MILLDSDLQILDDLMTPESVLKQATFEEAEKILPDKFWNFTGLKQARYDICHLLLLPVKTDEQRAHYKSIDKEAELISLLKVMAARPMALTDNKYPYLLPPDVNQQIIWVKEGVSRVELENFILKLMFRFELSRDDVITFERPTHVDTPMVKGTFKYMRHVHFWSRRW